MDFLEDLFGDLFEGREHKKRKSYDHGKHYDSKMVPLECPACDKPNPSIANFCMHCGIKLAKNDKRFCPNCGEEQAISSKFCPSCGEKQ